MVRVCAIPREQLRIDDLSRQIEEEGFAVARSRFHAGPWNLERPAETALMSRIQAERVPLSEFANAKPLRGITTGLNDAFLLDSETRNALVAADAKCSEIIKPSIRGQDIGRWAPTWAGNWMIVLKSSNDYQWPWSNSGESAETVFAVTYPSIYAHLNRLRDSAIKRQDQGKYWWELRSCAFWDLFLKPKIWFQQI